jgi:hypothetical protein
MRARSLSLCIVITQSKSEDCANCARSSGRAANIRQRLLPRGPPPGKEVDQSETNTSTTFSSNRKKKNHKPMVFLWLLFSQIIIKPDNSNKIMQRKRHFFFPPQPNKIWYPGVFFFPSKLFDIKIWQLFRLRIKILFELISREKINFKHFPIFFLEKKPQVIRVFCLKNFLLDFNDMKYESFNIIYIFLLDNLFNDFFWMNYN